MGDLTPFELPPEQTGEAAWYGPAMAQRTDWLMPLAAAEIAEIETAARALAAREADIASIAARDFPLPSLGPRLAARVRNEVLNGRGFLLLRGLPVERWSMREAATVSMAAQPSTASSWKRLLGMATLRAATTRPPVSATGTAMQHRSLASSSSSMA